MLDPTGGKDMPSSNIGGNPAFDIGGNMQS